MVKEHDSRASVPGFRFHFGAHCLCDFAQVPYSLVPQLPNLHISKIIIRVQ